MCRDDSSNVSRRPRSRSSTVMPNKVRGVVLSLLVAAATVVAACASRTLPPAVGPTSAHPDLLYPTIPVAMKQGFAAEHVDLGWRYLQIDDLRGADREFAAALKSSDKMYPAYVGQGYVAMLRRDFERAVTSFNLALSAERAYVPALVGRGQ